MSIRKRMTRAEQATDVRVRLLAAARSVFVRDGYYAASLDEVVRIAGLTKGAVYSRFSSKAELFLALLEERVAARDADLADAAHAGSRGVDVLFQKALDRMRGDEGWTLLVLEFRIAAARDPALNKRYMAIHDRVVAAVGNLVRAAAAGAGRGLVFPPEQVARVGLGFINGLLLEQVAGAGFSDAQANQINALQFDSLMTPKPRKRR